MVEADKRWGEAEKAIYEKYNIPEEKYGLWDDLGTGPAFSGVRRLANG